MEQSIFEELWNGNIAPYKACGENDPEIENLIDLINRNREHLEHNLGEEQKKRLENCLACYDEYSYLIAVYAFRSGFSLACKLLSQALANP